MSTKHPFQWISESSQNRTFGILILLTINVVIGLQLTGGPLKTSASPAGIVSFEFAGELDNAQAMIKSWGQGGQVYIGLNLGLDFLFLVLYSTTIGLACVIVGSLVTWGQSLLSKK
jgi:hypothetical protein